MGSLSVAVLDLADLRSVAAFARSWNGPLHILVNNAGIMAVPERELTPPGHELQFGTNFRGHFALTTALRPALVPGARIVSLSSNAHLPRLPGLVVRPVVGLRAVQDSVRAAGGGGDAAPVG